MLSSSTGTTRCAVAAVVLLMACSEQATAPVPMSMQLTIVSGNNQSAATGAELSTALVVKVTDSLGNPLAGRIVTFHVTKGGGSVFSGAGISASNGNVHERWRLGPSPADSQAVEVRAVDNASGKEVVYGTFTATATMPSGFNRLWVGGSSLEGDPQSWEFAENWYPDTVPTSIDNVLVPAYARSMPVLPNFAADETNNLTVQQGAAIDIGRPGEYSFMKTWGNTVVDGDIVGTQTIAIRGGTFRGNFSLARVEVDAAKLSGPATVNDTLFVYGPFDLNGKHLAVNGFATVTKGSLVMTAKSDTFDMKGQATVDSEPGATSGVIRLWGDIVGFPEADGFTVMAAGPSTQLLYPEGADGFTRFTNFTERKSGGDVEVVQKLFVNGTLRVDTGTFQVRATGSASTINLKLAAGTVLNNYGAIYYSGTYTHAGATINGNPPQFFALKPRKQSGR